MSANGLPLQLLRHIVGGKLRMRDENCFASRLVVSYRKYKKYVKHFLRGRDHRWWQLPIGSDRQSRHLLLRKKVYHHALEYHADTQCSFCAQETVFDSDCSNCSRGGTVLLYH